MEALDIIQAAISVIDASEGEESENVQQDLFDDLDVAVNRAARAYREVRSLLRLLDNA